MIMKAPKIGPFSGIGFFWSFVENLLSTSWYTRRCRVNKVKITCCTFTPSSPVVTLLYLVVTRSQLVTRYHSLSPVISFITRRHYHCISFYISSVHPKFQASILMNKKSFEKGGPSAPRKGRFAAHSRVNQHTCISFYSIYAFEISTFHLDKQKSAAFCSNARSTSRP